MCASHTDRSLLFLLLRSFCVSRRRMKLYLRGGKWRGGGRFNVIFRFLPLCFSELFVYIVMSLCFGIELFDPTGGWVCWHRSGTFETRCEKDIKLRELACSVLCGHIGALPERFLCSFNSVGRVMALWLHNSEAISPRIETVMEHFSFRKVRNRKCVILRCFRSLYARRRRTGALFSSVLTQYIFRIFVMFEKTLCVFGVFEHCKCLFFLELVESWDREKRN